jgi:hypothetical protein
MRGYVLFYTNVSVCLLSHPKCAADMDMSSHFDPGRLIPTSATSVPKVTGCQLQ